MSFFDDRCRRTEAEMAYVGDLAALNPGRLGAPMATDRMGSRIRVPLLQLRTAFSDDGDVQVRTADVEIEFVLPRDYPHARPGVFVRSEAQLFLAGVAQAPWPGVGWFGPVCVLRDYDPLVHGLVSHVIGVWDVLSGQVVGSEGNCLNRGAATWWLARDQELPFSPPLTLPPELDLAPAEPFVLIPLSDEERLG